MSFKSFITEERTPLIEGAMLLKMDNNRAVKMFVKDKKNLKRYIQTVYQGDLKSFVFSESKWKQLKTIIEDGEGKANIMDDYGTKLQVIADEDIANFQYEDLKFDIHVDALADVNKSLFTYPKIPAGTAMRRQPPRLAAFLNSPEAKKMNFNLKIERN